METRNISPFLRGLGHIGIPTNDLEESLAFYRGLGFSVALETVNEAAGERVAFLRLGDLTLELYENRGAALCEGAVNHIAVDVSDIERVYGFLLENGYELASNGVEFLPFWENGVKFCIIKGPNRENIEFCQRL